VTQLSGQGCINPTRLLVQDSIYEAVMDAAAAMLGQIPVGDPLDRSTVMGPVVNQASCDRILGMIDRSTEGGAGIVTGGERLGGDLANGYFISPTVDADVDNSSYIAQNEVFGPILSVLRFTDEDEAVRIVIDTRSGSRRTLRPRPPAGPSSRGADPGRQRLGQRIQWHSRRGPVRRLKVQWPRTSRWSSRYRGVHSAQEHLGQLEVSSGLNDVDLTCCGRLRHRGAAAHSCVDRVLPDSLGVATW
jgi:hypothetical protein